MRGEGRSRAAHSLIPPFDPVHSVDMDGPPPRRFVTPDTVGSVVPRGPRGPLTPSSASRQVAVVRVQKLDDLHCSQSSLPKQFYAKQETSSGFI